MPIESPFARAVIRDGSITLHPWSPRLIRGGPRMATLAGLPAALVDLSCTDERDLIVTPIPPTRLDDTARVALIAWATTVGYQRAWLPGEVVALDAQTAPIGRAAVRCPTCGARWQDEQLEFWEYVREHGGFPGRCMACGGMLPEWTLECMNDEASATGAIDAPVEAPGERSRSSPPGVER